MYFDAKETGMRIRQLRMEKDMTQEQMSEELHISDRHLRYIEKGGKNVTVDMIADIAIFFDVSVDYLVFGKNSPYISMKQGLREAIRILSECEENL